MFLAADEYLRCRKADTRFDVCMYVASVVHACGVIHSLVAVLVVLKPESEREDFPRDGGVTGDMQRAVSSRLLSEKHWVRHAQPGICHAKQRGPSPENRISAVICSKRAATREETLLPRG